jgi:hypothetical protein
MSTSTQPRWVSILRWPRWTIGSVSDAIRLDFEAALIGDGSSSSLAHLGVCVVDIEAALAEVDDRVPSSMTGVWVSRQP